jgi:hypothetical protein
MRQTTLVATYGTKPNEFSELIETYQSHLEARFGQNFKKYNIHQVHGTVIGLERVEGSRYNRNLAVFRGEWRTMNLSEYLDLLIHENDLLPLTIQVGGFAKDVDYRFLSRGQTPYERSFSIQGDKAVLMGWPVIPEFNTYPETLENHRKSAANFNILHSWHRKSGDIDNDFYMRIGLFNPVPTDKSVINFLQTEMRDKLAKKPINVKITREVLRIVSYNDETLPLANSIPWSLDEARALGSVESLYSD